MEDQKIVELYWAREERAIQETAKKYGNYLSSIAMRILRNRQDTEECVSDTYRGAWDSIPPNRPEILSAYLAKIARRIAMKIWRGRDAQKRGGGETALSLEELGECIPDGRAIDETLSAKELAKAIDTFLLELSEEERRVFIRRYFYGFPVADIRKQFGFSKSKTESMLHRTRKKLKAYLQKEGYIHDC